VKIQLKDKATGKRYFSWYTGLVNRVKDKEK
jgi:hypothetical protein